MELGRRSSDSESLGGFVHYNSLTLIRLARSIQSSAFAHLAVAPRFVNVCRMNPLFILRAENRQNFCRGREVPFNALAAVHLGFVYGLR